MKDKLKNAVLNVSVVTLGCAKNTVDSEKLVALLADKGLNAVHVDSSVDNPDVVIVNTCGFINDAKQESIDTIFDYLNAKKEGLIKKVIVMGCLSERYRAELKAEMPEVDGFFGVSEFSEIVKLLANNSDSILIPNRVLSTPKHFAYLKISEGCNHRCSFCAIPNIRGKYESFKFEDLLEEAKLLAENGVKELIVIAQDTTYYGFDKNKKRSLANLLNSLSNIKGIEWVRLQYAYPWQFPVDFLDVMRDNSKICNYLDIPFQHINDRLLLSMLRRVDKKETIDLINTIKTKVPNIALRTSLIVGYPGETKKEFEELVAFVKDVEFDRLGVFTYSHEENTKAFLLKDNIRKSEKQKRSDILMEIQQEISLKKNTEKIGQNYKVLIDSIENDTFIGRTEFDSPEVDNEVYIKKQAGIKVGEFYNVKIQSADAYDLTGIVMKK
ncbi:MAG: 30S ribosomal protein S12 methylthiotransferase RimO [Bacteroidota bacterium]